MIILPNFNTFLRFLGPLAELLDVRSTLKNLVPFTLVVVDGANELSIMNANFSIVISDIQSPNNFKFVVVQRINISGKNYRT